MNHDTIRSLMGSGTSLLATIAAWQEQAQFYVATAASIVSFAAAIISIYYAIKSHRKTKP